MKRQGSGYLFESCRLSGSCNRRGTENTYSRYPSLARISLMTGGPFRACGELTSKICRIDAMLMNTTASA